MRVIFETDNISVSVSDGARDDIWVTFGYLGGIEPFGLSYLADIGQAGVYVISKPNHWFQHSEIHEALKVINLEVADVKGRRILYGSSMGAFAAVAFSERLGATHVIAAAPQTSISRAVVGTFDNRWTHIGDKLTFEFEDARASMSRSARIVVIYDNLHAIDRVHASLLSECANVELYPFPAAGHHVLHTLQSAAVLKNALAAVLTAPAQAAIEMKRIKMRYRTARGNLSTYYHALGEHYHGTGNKRRAVRYYAMACLKKPILPQSFYQLATDFKEVQSEPDAPWREQSAVGEDLVLAVIENAGNGWFLFEECLRVTRELQGYGFLALAIGLTEAALKYWPNQPELLRTGAWLLRLKAQDLMTKSLDLALRSNTGDAYELAWEIDAIYVLILLNRPEEAKAFMRRAQGRHPHDGSIPAFLALFPAADFLKDIDSA